ncbi:MAG: RidA family protein [Chloroflexota bacterium]
MPSIERINPPTLAAPPGGRYAHVVRAGSLVWIAGQTARNAAGELVGPGDALAQSRQVYENLRAAMESVGGGLEHLTKVTVYLTREVDVAASRQAQDEYAAAHPVPASTMVVIKALARPEYLVEIEAFAVLPG